MYGFLKAFGEFWCRLMHSEISWPMRGKYYCLTCRRVYTIAWARPPVYADARVQEPLPTSREPRSVLPAG
jgi:hypothetical protein